MVPPGLCWEVGLRRAPPMDVLALPPGASQAQVREAPRPRPTVAKPQVLPGAERGRGLQPLCAPAPPSRSRGTQGWEVTPELLSSWSSVSPVLGLCSGPQDCSNRTPHPTAHGSRGRKPRVEAAWAGRGLGTLGTVSSLPPQRPAGRSRPSVPVASLRPPPPPPRGLRCVVFLLLLLLGTFVSGFGAHLSQPG